MQFRVLQLCLWVYIHEEGFKTSTPLSNMLYAFLYFSPGYKHIHLYPGNEFASSCWDMVCLVEDCSEENDSIHVCSQSLKSREESHHIDSPALKMRRYQN